MYNYVSLYCSRLVFQEVVHLPFLSNLLTPRSGPPQADAAAAEHSRQQPQPQQPDISGTSSNATAALRGQQPNVHASSANAAAGANAPPAVDKNASLSPVDKNDTAQRLAALHHQGQTAVQKNDFETAIEAFQQELAHKGDPACTLAVRTRAYSGLLFIYSSKRQYSRLVQCSLDYLQECREEYGDDAPQTAGAYVVLAPARTDLGQSESALESYEKAVAIYSRTLGSSCDQLAALYSQMVTACIVHDDIHRSLDFAQKALTIRRTTVGDDHVDTAMAYEALGRVYRSRGGPRHTGNFVKQPEQYERAAECLEKALAIFRREYGSDHVDTARVGIRLAGVHVDIVDAVGEDNARVSLEEAIALCHDPNRFHAGLPAVSAYEAATFHYEQGKLFNVLQQHRRATASFHNALYCVSLMRDYRTRDAPSNILVAETQTCLGSSYMAQGDLTRALQHFTQALDIYSPWFNGDDGNTNVRTARAHMDVASVCSAQEKKRLALEHTEKAIRIYLRAGREKDPEMAVAYANMGLMCHALGHGLAPTINNLRTAQRIYSHAVGDGNINTAQMHANIGGVFIGHDKPEQAEPHYLAAYTAYQGEYGNNHEKTGQMCYDYANALREQGKLDEALKYFAKAVCTARRIYGRNDLSVGRTTYLIAGLALTQGNFAAAIEFFREAQAIFCMQYGPSHECTIEAGDNLTAAFTARTQQLYSFTDEDVLEYIDSVIAEETLYASLRRN